MSTPPVGASSTHTTTPARSGRAILTPISPRTPWLRLHHQRQSFGIQVLATLTPKASSIRSARENRSRSKGQNGS